MKYTPQQEDRMAAMYQSIPENDMSEAAFAERAEVIQDLADIYKKTPRMIIAKLSKMKIYITKPKVSKVTGKPPETKEAMVRRLERKHNWSSGDYDGLEKAPKIVLQKLLKEYATK